MLNELLAKKAIEVGAKVLESKFLETEKQKTKDDVTPSRLSTHLSYVANWSAQVQIFGFGRIQDTDLETIELAYQGSARKFRGKKNDKNLQTEVSILSSQNHVILVGDPGAGKTTSLKRLTRMVLLGDVPDDINPPSLPILIRLKEIESYTDIYQLIAEVLGFQVVTKHRIVIEEKKSKDINEEDKEVVVIEKVEKKIPYPAIGETQIDVFLKTFLDETGVLLLLDGLDELRDEFLEPVRKGIQDFSMTLATARVVVTARTGFYYGVKSLSLIHI